MICSWTQELSTQSMQCISPNGLAKQPIILLQMQAKKLSEQFYGPNFMLPYTLNVGYLLLPRSFSLYLLFLPLAFLIFFEPFWHVLCLRHACLKWPSGKSQKHALWLMGCIRHTLKHCPEQLHVWILPNCISAAATAASRQTLLTLCAVENLYINALCTVCPEEYMHYFVWWSFPMEYIIGGHSLEGKNQSWC